MGLCKVTFTRVVVVVFLCFLAYYCYLIYHIFNPPQCSKEQPRRCINPAYSRDKVLELWVYSSPKASFGGNIQNLELLLHKSDLLRSDDFKQEINVSLPDSTLNNGSLYVHMFLGLKGNSPHYHSNRQKMAAVTSPLTRYAIPESTTFNLLMGEYENSTWDERPITHWIPWLDIHSLADDWKFDRYNLPAEVMKILHLLPGTPQYLPILYVDRLKVMTKHLKPISSENVSMPLEISYSSVGIGQLRLWLLFGEAMENMRNLGFSEKEFDDVKGIFLDSSLWLLGLTVFVSFFHLLFDFLAFKNDIGFWRGRKTMVGLSTRTLIWQTFSHTVVFLYLLDEKTSLLVSIPMGIATIIEFWKLGKAFKVRVIWSGWLPKIERGGRLKVEQETESYDSEAMRYLSYLLIPLVTAGAVYQLLYSSYKSWYSWIIHCLVNGVYAFGFLFMLPQLFLNYKLKSVAHLPWRAFMYKAFNTFIDDVFAFIIVMPTSHRLAVFRDDLVFMVYLYQRWLYPVDRSRVNEYGESFEEIKEHKD